jgi:hypothetical protein
MTYRDDLLAKRQQAERIAGELRDVRRRMNEIHALKDTERELDKALDAASRDAGRARSKVALPLLENIKVASPCHERWENMDGDSRVRNCGKCEKSVYDLSAMTREAAENLLADHGTNLCVRFYRRPDGTVMTADCPVGARRKRIRNVVVGAGAAAFSLVAASGLVISATTMGEVGTVTVGSLHSDYAEMGEYDETLVQGGLSDIDESPEVPRQDPPTEDETVPEVSPELE